ncbi:alpha/beta-hydrolase [Lentithecium fluviatile CBS 122367]|uniref:Alpha/beta-hydrolase n=1 Tax=Lentithecium fluviatile CBS 122367 TaxID=1168545 RepID=A0A6G1J5X7_9PLEO|nr:alpha/beta-hydrolase [Lentithecium fluviatile CBS 122367]
MTADASCDQCIKGSIHADQPLGKEEPLYGLNTYIVGNRANPRATIVMYSDVFGLPFPNNRLMVDAYAKGGKYLVYLPDFFEGDPVKVQLADIVIPVDEKKESTLAKFTGILANLPAFLMWRRRHTVPHTDKVCMEFLEKLRRAPYGTQKIGIVGLCWAGKYALRAARESNKIDIDGVKIALVDAAVGLHPSNLVLPEDVENLIAPVSFGWGEQDTRVKLELKRKIEEIHKKGKYAGSTVPKVEHKIYKPGRHGFAVGGNPDDPLERACLEDSEKQVLDWFGRWL